MARRSWKLLSVRAFPFSVAVVVQVGKVNSRLACQVKVSDILDGMVVSVP